MNIRKATLNDLEYVQLLNQKLFRNDIKFDRTLDLNWSAKNTDYFKKRIAGKKAITFVAEKNGKIIAYLIICVINAQNYRTIKKIAELENMFVTKEERRRGVGTQLIR